ncbi:Rha family transcriptional regulator [Escherichia coli]|nr:Rha family transcriptional regulator [Escherichia coli]
MNELINGNAIKMTSIEIAELVSKRHDNVKRTIETLAKNGVIRLPQIEVSERINNLGFNVQYEHYVFEGEQGNRQGTITVSAEGLQVGDAFTIAGVNSVHQITKDTTGQPQVFRVLAVSGTTVTISPKILPPDNADVASRPYANVDANAASSAAITILNKNAAPANLFWADGSVELMYGKLAFPTGQGPQVMTATTEQGATLIMSYAFDHIKGVTTARFTTLYGCSVLVPEYTGIVIAGQ